MKKLVFSTLLFLVSATPAFAAGITFDNKAAGENNSFSFTVGTNPNDVIVLFEHASNINSGGSLSTPTLGGNNFTNLDAATVNGVGNNCSSWILTNPPTGAQTVSLPSSGFSQPTFIWYLIYSYSGAAQSGQPDAHGLATGGNTGTVSKQITTVANNSLIVGAGMDTGGVNPTVTTGTNNTTSSGTSKGGDFGVLSGGTSETTSVTSTGEPRCASEVSIAPFVASPATASTVGLVNAFWLF